MISPDKAARFLCRKIIPAITGKTFKDAPFIRNYYPESCVAYNRFARCKGCVARCEDYEKKAPVTRCKE